MILDTIKTQAESIAEQIRTLILNGTFQPGQPLRQEALAERLNVSRTPLRHALQSLAGDGLVEAVGYKGAKVAEPERGVIRDLFEMRLLLEPLALRSAVGLHTKLDLAEAEMALDAADAAREPSVLSKLNWDFHYALYRPSGRGTLLRTIEQLNRASALADLIGSSIVTRRDGSAVEHRLLLEACRAGDQVRAIILLKKHLQLAFDSIRNE